MADNVRVFEAAAGADIRTIDRGPAETQVVSLDVAQAGAAELLGLPTHRTVDVVVPNMTLSGGVAYSANDVVGSEMTFAGMARAAGRGLLIKDARLFDDAKAIPTSTTAVVMELFLFDSPSTPAADNAAAAWTDTDMRRLVAVVPFWVASSADPFSGLQTNQNVLQPSEKWSAIRLPMPATPVGGTALYGTLVARQLNGSPTLQPAQGTLAIRLKYLPD